MASKALAALDPSTSDDQTSITWHDPQYPYVLNRNSVMHYFEFSPFFDRNSNNMLARRQNLDPAEPGVLESIPVENPPRVEYVIEVAQPPHLFVIRKQQRKEAAAAPLTLAYYYVLDKMVYQAPTLHAALSTRLRRCLWSLKEGFQRLKTDLDPLQLLLRDEEKQKRKLEQQQAAGTEPDTDGGRAQEDSGPSTRAYSAEDERRWRKAANIIDSVMSQFPLPKMPPEYWPKQPQQQPQAPQAAPGGDAAQKQQQQQQQQEEEPKAGAPQKPSNGAPQASKPEAGSAPPPAAGAAKRARH